METQKTSVLFESFDNEKFVYRQRDGAILKISSDKFSEPKCKTSFGINKEVVKNNLEHSLELLILNVTDNCNLRCKYCLYSGNYEGEPTYGTNIMSLGIAKTSIDYLFKHSIKARQRIVSFYGGEPLLEDNRSLVESSTDYARKKSIENSASVKFSLVTNGTNLTNWVDWLTKNEVLLFVSLDGPRGVQDKWRGEESFEKVFTGLEKIKEFDQQYFDKKVSFSSTFVEPNDLLFIREFFNNQFPRNRLRISGVRIPGLDPNSLMIKDIDKKMTRKMYYQFAHEFADIVSKENNPDNFLKGLFDQMLMIIYYRQRGNLKGSVWPTNTCVPGGKKLFVKEDGKLYPCEKVYGEDFEIGNINSGVDFDKVEKLLNRYADLCNVSCTNCWGSRICGSCFSSMRRGETIDKNIMGEVCPNKLENLLLGLSIYTTIVNRNKWSIQKYLNSISPIE
ncbi:MAG: radical SAM protein [Nanoarchaeota archaeon]